MDKITDIIFTEKKLMVEDAVEKVSSEWCGATSVFVGTTRDNKNGRSIVKLEYECYVEMAKKEVNKICDQLRNEWQDIHHILIWHRLGAVPVKEASIIIAISSPFRSAAISATERCINSFKAFVPIWKKEVYKDGSSEWMENKECSWNEEYSRERHKISNSSVVHTEAS